MLARRGQFAEAECVARECVARADATGWWVGQGQAHTALADVLLMSGKRDDAVTALEEALQLSERKGNLVSAQSARMRLAELRDTTISA